VPRRNPSKQPAPGMPQQPTGYRKQPARYWRRWVRPVRKHLRTSRFWRVLATRLLPDPRARTATTAARAKPDRRCGPRPEISGLIGLALPPSRLTLVRPAAQVERRQRAQEPAATVTTACEMAHRLIAPDHAADRAVVGDVRPLRHGSTSSSSSIRPREAAQRLTSCRELSCSLRRTAPTWDSTVRALMPSRIAMRL
jgi:hypothetical protein